MADRQTIRVAVVRARISYDAKQNGWKLLSFKERWDRNFDISLQYQSQFFRDAPVSRVNLIAPLHQAYATVHAYITGVAGVYWLGERK